MLGVRLRSREDLKIADPQKDLKLMWFESNTEERKTVSVAFLSCLSVTYAWY
jgi:hypothetical protein